MNDDKALELSIEYDQAVVQSERWDDFKERSIRGDEYYVGLQTWTTEQKQKNADAGKPLLTFNEVLPIINYLTSVERDNRKDAKVEARRGGFDAVAELLTKLNKHTMDISKGDFIKSEVFLNGLRGVLGWFKLEISYDNEPVTGEIILRSRPSLAVRSDPCCMTYDLNDPNGAQFVIDHEFVSRQRLQALYPDKKKDIETAIGDYLGRQKRGVTQRVIDYMFGHTLVDEADSEVLFDQDLMDRWRCRYSETFYKEYVTRTMVVDRRKWEVWWFDPRKKADGQKLEKIKEVASEYPKVFEIKEKTPMSLMHKTCRIGDLLLEHKEDPFNGMCLFPLIPYSPLGEAQYDMGMEDNLIGPQDEVNKRMTNAVHILNQTANGGVVVNELDAGYGDILREYGSSPNMVIEKNKCGGFFEQLLPKPISAGHVQLQGISKNFLEEISGVTGSSRGYEPSRQESGKLYREKVKQSMSTNQIIYDRFDYSTQILYETMTEMIRRTDIYTEQEISSIIDDEQLLTDDILNEARQIIIKQNPPPTAPNGQMLAMLAPDNQKAFMGMYEQQMAQYQQWAEPQAIEMAKKRLFELVRAYRTGRYGIVVLQSPNAPTTQMSNLFALDSIKDMMPPEIILPHIIRATGLSKDAKDDIIDKLESMSVETPQVA